MKVTQPLDRELIDKYYVGHCRGAPRRAGVLRRPPRSPPHLAALLPRRVRERETGGGADGDHSHGDGPE